MKIIKITGPLAAVRYWNGEAYKLIGWDENEETALKLARGLEKRNRVKVVLNNTTYGVYYTDRLL
jgi:hypothetical protein